MINDRNKHIISLLVLITLSIFGKAQTSTDAVIERIAESLIETMGEESDASELISQLQYYAQFPLPINSANYAELESLYFLNTKQIKDILHYRTIHGQFLTIFELQAVESIPQQTAQELSLFITLDLLQPKVQRGRNSQSVIIRYAQSHPKSRGYEIQESGSPKYEGSPTQLYLNYRGQISNVSWSLVGDKDAGESFFKASNPHGYDFYSAYIQYSRNESKFIVGDYQIKVGQGLSQWSSFGIRKSSETTAIKQIGQGTIASSSVDENSYLRGISAMFTPWKNVGILGFLSFKKRDANISEQDSIICITSLQTSGYHRTENEIEDEKEVNEFTSGAVISYRFSDHRISVYGTANKLDKTIVLKDNPYNAPRFTGKTNWNTGFEFMASAKNIDLFGEYAISKSKGMALLVGTNLYPSDQLNLAILYRNFSKDFHTFYGSAFADSDGNRNEKGLYLGTTIYTIPHFKISAYTDLYASHWQKYTTNRPIYGNETMVQLDYSFNKKISGYLRYKYESNFEEQTGNAWVNDDIKQENKKFRIHSQFDLNNHFTIRGRYERSNYSKTDNSKGWLSYLDFIMKYEKFSLYIRTCYFDTDDYDSRIYTYENDVPRYAYTPALSDQGLRGYLYTNVKFLKSFTAYFKYDITYYFNRDSIGSGYDTIESSHKSKFKIQIRWKPYIPSKKITMH